jgi:hypothetical protein
MLLLVLLVVLTAQSFPQTTFSRVIDSSQVYSAVCDEENEVYMAGQAYDDLYSLNGILITRMAPNSTIKWAKKIGNQYVEYANAIVNKADTLFVAGALINTGLQYTNFSCIKLTVDGDTLWTRMIDFGVKSVASSAFYCEDNGFLVTGWVYNSWDFQEIGIARLNADGELLWAKTYNLGALRVNPRSIKQLDDGNIIIVGDYAEYWGFSLKLDQNGDFVKAANYNTADFVEISLNDVIPNTNGMMLYFTEEKTFLAQIDTAGNLVWARGQNFGSIFWTGSEAKAFTKLTRTADNGFLYVIGQEPNFGSVSTSFKTDSLGFISQSTHFELPVQCLLNMEDGGYLALGNGPLNVPKNAIFGEPQIGLVRVDSTGYSDSCSYSSMFFESPIDLVVSDLFIMQTGTGSLVSQHIYVEDVTLFKRSGCVDIVGGIADNTPGTFQLIASPNPTSGQFELSFSDNNMHKVSSLEVVNALGDVVYQSFNSISSTISIDLSHQARGIYLIKALSNDKVFVAKVLVTD